MECPRPSSVQRKMSFNPEAAAFSPTPSAATPNSKEPVRTSSTSSHSIPSELYDRLMARQYELQSQPKGTNSNFDRAPTASTSSTVSSVDFFSQHPDVRNLAQTGHEQNGASGRHIQFNQALDTNTMGGMMMHTSSFAFHPQAPKPDLYELNISLGLPGLNIDIATEGSPSHSRVPRPPPGFSSTHAQYLGKVNSASSDDTVTGPAMTVDSSVPTNECEQEFKVVQPPPGFSGEASRTIAVEKPRSDSPFTMEPKHVPTNSTVHQSSQRNSQVRPAHHMQPFPNFMRGSPSKRRPRASTRTKRMDQGPEPSAADIYPDDAKWEPSRSPQTFRRPSVREPFVSRLPPLQEVCTNDTISWPTPAEVYMPKPLPPLRTTPPGVVDDVGPPTADDIKDDEAVLALIDSVPHINIDMFLHFGVLDVVSDERPLTANQLNGKAYGLKNHGLGLGSLGDDWNPEIVPQRQPFGLPAKHESPWE